MKTVLVTGGSRGIGAAMVEKFAASGYRVIINYNSSKEAAESLASRIGAAALRADVGSPEEVGAMFEQINSRFGGVDVLVNNAGISKISLMTDCSESEWQRIINVNLGGAYRVTKAALGYMINRKDGCIINISSMWGVSGASCEAAYSASKAGLIGLTKALAKELGPSGIRVNAIAPGLIDTDMNMELDAETRRGLIGETPLMRIGTPEDVAGLACFLAGGGGAFITGQVFGVNGGFVI